MDVVTIQACRLLFLEADAMVNFNNTKPTLILCEQFDSNVPATRIGIDVFWDVAL